MLPNASNEGFLVKQLRTEIAQLQNRLDAVETENDVLRERVLQLQKEQRIQVTLPVEFELTVKEEEMVAFLMGRESSTKEALMTAMYGDRPDGDRMPEIKIVDVFVCKVRKKLLPWGIQINTLWGRGYTMPKESKQKIMEMVHKTEV